MSRNPNRLAKSDRASRPALNSSILHYPTYFQYVIRWKNFRTFGHKGSAPLRIVLGPYVRTHRKTLFFNGLWFGAAGTVWHVQCTPTCRSQRSPSGTQMAVACASSGRLIGKAQERAVYVDSPFFAKTSALRNATSRLMHTITPGSPSAKRGSRSPRR